MPAGAGTLYTLFEGAGVGLHLLTIPPGAQRAFLKTGADTIAVAMHREVYVSQKVVSTENGEKRMPLERGDFFYRPAGMATGGWFVGRDRPFDQLFVSFPPASQTLLSEDDGRRLVSSDKKAPVVRAGTAAARADGRPATIFLEGGVEVQAIRASAPVLLVNPQDSAEVLFPLDGLAAIGDGAAAQSLGPSTVYVLRPGERATLRPESGGPFAGLIFRRGAGGGPAPTPTANPEPPPREAAPASHDAKATIGVAGIEWVTIPGGVFQMGSDSGDERPVHEVRVPTFDISRTAVTFRQYRACVTAGACAPVDEKCAGVESTGDEQPVVCVDWSQASAFARWAGGRLPSEAEWEYAARSGGKTRKFPWGDEEPTCERAVLNHGDGLGCGRKAAWPVCSKPKGNTEHGLCDMAGNVWQWVQDRKHRSYVGAPADGSAWETPATKHRVQRGGTWSFNANFARTTARSGDVPELRGDYIGFRVARRTP